MHFPTSRKIDQTIKKLLRLCDADPAHFLKGKDESAKLENLFQLVNKLEEQQGEAVRMRAEMTSSRKNGKHRGRINNLNEVLKVTNQKLSDELIARKKSDEDFKKNGAKFKQIVENATDVIYTCDSYGYFTYINKACQRVTGFPRDYFIDKHFTQIVADEWKENVARFYKNQFDNRIRKTLYSFPINTKSGKIKWVEQTVFQVIEGDRVIEHQAVVRDVTERKKVADTLERYVKQIAELNEELQQKFTELEVANNELKAFSYTISHDLRAPLRAINSYAAILLEEYEDKFDKAALESIKKVISNAVRMGQLIDQLLAFSNLGRKEIQKRKLNMRKLAEEVFEELTLLMPVNNVKVKIAKLPPAEADYDLIRQVFLNLMSNAIKFSASCKSPTVCVDFYKKDNRVVYYVKDNGVGFDMRYYDKLFGVFQKLHEAHEYAGTGAGLAIVKRIIDKHGGEIWAESKLNEGACFYFSFSLEKKDK